MMATKVVMAQLSPTMEEGKLVAWKLAEGDPVSQGDIVAEIEVEDLADIPPILSEHIRTIDGVENTTSLVTFPG